jgi:hypothetical protein
MICLSGSTADEEFHDKFILVDAVTRTICAKNQFVGF